MIYPSILLHPNIPKPLHTMAPRVFLGAEWWESTKSIAKAKFDNHCWACGVHKSEAKYHQWLEAHECYSMDYSIGRVEYVGTVALCHSCHNYIHDGRMGILAQKGKIPTEKYIDILYHGNEILGNFTNSTGTIFRLKKEPFKAINLSQVYPGGLQPPNCRWHGEGAEWGDYHMVINGQVYNAKFKSLTEWKNYWGEQCFN